MTLSVPIALLLLLAAPAPLPAPLEAQLRAAAPEGCTLAVRGWEPRLPVGCAPERAELRGDAARSGRRAVRLVGRDAAGRGCEGWAWADVEVRGPALKLVRAVRAGQPLQDAVAAVEVERVAGRPVYTDAPAGLLAARDLPAGTVLEPQHVREPRPEPGASITVELRRGALLVTQAAQVVGCGRDRTCARLASGRRVEGRVVDGRLVVEAP